MGKIFLNSCIGWILISNICLNGNCTRHGFAKYYDVEDRFTDCGTTHKAYDFVGAISMEFLLNPALEYKKPICESTATVLNPTNDLQITVAVQDYCDNCTVNDIVLSEGAFPALGGDFSTGQFRVIWEIDMDTTESNDAREQQGVPEFVVEEKSSNYFITIILNVFDSLKAVWL